jgi:hypothetical protein
MLQCPTNNKNSHNLNFLFFYFSCFLLYSIDDESPKLFPGFYSWLGMECTSLWNVGISSSIYIYAIV